MTVQDVSDRLAEIRRLANEQKDDEEAHAAQDELLVDVLRAIAADAIEPSALAAAALGVLDIQFSRWCA